MSDRRAPARVEPAREVRARNAQTRAGIVGEVPEHDAPDYDALDHDALDHDALDHDALDRNAAARAVLDHDAPDHVVSGRDLATLPAAILCGGLGTRLRSVVSDRSKVVADVAGRPFLSYLLSDLAAAGLRRAILCTGHQAESVQALYGATFDSLQLAYSHEPSPLGTGGALALAARRCDGDLLLALNGDSRCAIDLRGLFAQHAASGCPAALAVCQVPDTSTFGRVVFDASHRVNAFIEKGGPPPSASDAAKADRPADRSADHPVERPAERPADRPADRSIDRPIDRPVAPQAGWVNAGVYILPTAWLRSVPIDRPVSLERDLLPAWIARGITAFPVAGPLIDIGTPERLAAAQSGLR